MPTVEFVPVGEMLPRRALQPGGSDPDGETSEVAGVDEVFI